MQDNQQQLELDMEQWTGSKLGKEYVKAVNCHRAYLTYKHSISCKMLDVVKIVGRNLNNLRYTDDITLTAESEELKSLLKKVTEESVKAGLKFNIQKTKNMASSPITSWQTDGENVETVSDFTFLGSKINADGDCSHKIKRHLPLGIIDMTNLDSVLKSTDNILLIKVHIVKAMVFPLVVFGYESWTIKKLEN